MRNATSDACPTQQGMDCSAGWVRVILFLKVNGQPMGLTIVLAGNLNEDFEINKWKGSNREMFFLHSFVLCSNFMVSSKYVRLFTLISFPLMASCP